MEPPNRENRPGIELDLDEVPGNKGLAELLQEGRLPPGATRLAEAAEELLSGSPKPRFAA